MNVRRKTRKERSNNVRLAALERRQRSDCIAETSTAQHIVFSDESDSDHNIKLTLFESEGEDEVEAFWSDTGEEAVKLLHMQRRIGVDQRFRLNRTFLDRDKPDIPSVIKVTEKERSLAVIDNLFGSRPNEKAVDVVIPPRYDPLSVTHTDLEQESADVASSSEESSAECDSPTVSSPTMCCQTKYFAINTDLKDLFSTQTFTFLGDQSFMSDIEPQEMAEPNVHKTVIMERLQITTSPVEHTHERGFFCSDKLSHSFHRSVPLCELEAGWPDKRTAFKQCFRKRHREAVKTVYKVRKHNHPTI